MIIPTSTSAIITTEQITTIPLSSTMIDTSTLPRVTIQQRLLVSNKPRMYDSFSSLESLTTMKSNIKSMVHLPASSFMLKTTLPSPTPWYPPDGLFDWWQWQWYTTKFPKVPLQFLTTNQTPISSTRTTTTLTVTTTVTTSPHTTRSIINLMNTTNRTAITRKNGVTVDWFKWPHIESISSTKRQPDYYDDDYPEYSVTTRIQNSISTNSLISILPDTQRKKYQQLSVFPTQSNWHVNNPGITINTPSSKRHYTQPNTGMIGERNGVTGIQLNGKIARCLQTKSLGF